MFITYINYHQKLCKSALRYQEELYTCVLDLKMRIEQVRCGQRRNGFLGTNSFFKCTPILIFAAGRVRQRNGVEPSKTRVLLLKEWMGHVCCKKKETVLEAQTRALNVPRYRFLQRVKCGYEMAWNHKNMSFRQK